MAATARCCLLCCIGVAREWTRFYLHSKLKNRHLWNFIQNLSFLMWVHPIVVVVARFACRTLTARLGVFLLESFLHILFLLFILSNYLLAALSVACLQLLLFFSNSQNRRYFLSKRRHFIQLLSTFSCYCYRYFRSSLYKIILEIFSLLVHLPQHPFFDVFFFWEIIFSPDSFIIVAYIFISSRID